MPFAIVGFFLGLRARAEQGSNVDLFSWPFLRIFILVILCMLFARSAAMAFNRYLDRAYDARNPRTATREIPAGKIGSENALLFVIVNCLLFVTACFFINRICFFLSPVALFVILFYSYTKRITSLCHLVLGLGLSLAPIGAYLAVQARFDLLPVLFSVLVFFWVSGFDIIYALQDEEFDRSENLYSIPSVLGKPRALLLSRALHFLSACVITVIAMVGQFGSWYLVGGSIFVAMLAYQQSIVSATDLRRVTLAFATTNGFASIIFSVFVLLDLYFRH